MDIGRNDLTVEEVKLFDNVMKQRADLTENESKLEMIFDQHRNEKIEQYIGKTYEDENGNYIMIIGYRDMVIQVIELMSDTVIHFTSIHTLGMHTEIPKKTFLTRYHALLKMFVDRIGE